MQVLLPGSMLKESLSTEVLSGRTFLPLIRQLPGCDLGDQSSNKGPYNCHTEECNVVPYPLPDRDEEEREQHHGAGINEAGPRHHLHGTVLPQLSGSDVVGVMRSASDQNFLPIHFTAWYPATVETVSSAED